MKHSLEVACPSSPRLVEWSMSVPGRRSSRRFAPRRFCGRAPGRVARAGSPLRKAGFNAPLPPLVPGRLRCAAGEPHSEQDASCSAHLQLDEVRRLLAEHRTGGPTTLTSYGAR